MSLAADLCRGLGWLGLILSALAVWLVDSFQASSTIGLLVTGFCIALIVVGQVLDFWAKHQLPSD